jgi:hypothetical protein
MKGIIFNLLEKVVVTAHGEDMWDDLIEDAGVSGSYTSLGSYPDEEIEALLAAACRKTGLTRAQVLQWFGQQALPLIRDAYPHLFTDHSSSRDFVLSVNDKIHPEVRKLYPEASCPFFHIKAASSDAVTMEYKSPRDLAELAHGFIVGAAHLYDDKVEVVLDSSQPGGKLDHLSLFYDPR